MHLVATGRVGTRSRARDLIRRGLVRVDGTVVDRASKQVDGSEAISLDDVAAGFVSRGSEKLIAALDGFGFSPEGLRCLDLGASTGGFVDVLLERGAGHVVAVDVGREQLHSDLAADPRVTALEQTDARNLARADVRGTIQAITADLSFISLTKAIGAALNLAETGAWLVALVKPQFEVGPDRVGSGGIVRDEAAIAEAVDRVIGWINSRNGWRVVGQMPSPIAGGSGNLEFLVGARRDRDPVDG